MLLHTAPQDQAILSNVGEVGDFKIKASAKAFTAPVQENANVQFGSPNGS